MTLTERPGPVSGVALTEGRLIVQSVRALMVRDAGFASPHHEELILVLRSARRARLEP